MMKSRKNYLKRFTTSPNGMDRKTTPYKQLPHNRDHNCFGYLSSDLCFLFSVFGLLKPDT